MATEETAVEETAVLIPVPEAEPVVREIRAWLDPEPALSVPAHVTLLYPFVPPERLTPDVVDRARHAIAGVAPFDAELTSASSFDDSVLWLAPEPATRFGELIDRLARAFPEYPPYGGAYSSVVPHLTIGKGFTAGQVVEAARRAPTRLPIGFRVERAVLMTGAPDDGPWRVRAEFTLGSR